MPGARPSLWKRAGTRLRPTWTRLTYGLTRKVSLFVFMLLTTFTVTLTTVNILAEQEVVEERLKRNARGVAAMLADFARNYLTDLRMNELQVIVRDIQRREGILYAYVMDANDNPIVDGEPGRETMTEGRPSRQAHVTGQGSLMLEQELEGSKPSLYANQVNCLADMCFLRVRA